MWLLSCCVETGLGSLSELSLWRTWSSGGELRGCVETGLKRMIATRGRAAIGSEPMWWRVRRGALMGFEAPSAVSLGSLYAGQEQQCVSER